MQQKVVLGSVFNFFNILHALCITFYRLTPDCFIHCMNAVPQVDTLVVYSLNQHNAYTSRSSKNFARRGNVHPGVVWLNVRFRNLAALYDKRISLASGLAEDCCAIECQVKGVG